MKINKFWLTFFGSLALAAFIHTGPTRETGCIKYAGYNNTSDGNQRVIFENKTYNAGIGFNPDSLKVGRNYNATLKRYFLGLGKEKILGATACLPDTSSTLEARTQ